MSESTESHWRSPDGHCWHAEKMDSTEEKCCECGLTKARLFFYTRQQINTPPRCPGKQVEQPGYPARNPVQRAKALLASLTEAQRAEVLKVEAVEERPVVISAACYQAVLAVQHPDPDSRLIRQLRAALPHILSANPWVYDAEIRRRIEAAANRDGLIHVVLGHPAVGRGDGVIHVSRMREVLGVGGAGVGG